MSGEHETGASDAGGLPHGGHEPDRVPLRPIAIGATAIAVLLVLGVVVPTGLRPLFLAREARESAPASPLLASSGRQLPPAPRLQVNPWRDIAELRASEMQTLESYAWVDRSAGIARIPIDRAIDLLAQRAAASGGAPGAVPGRPR